MKKTKDTVKVQISLPRDIHEKYKATADRTGVTLSSLIVLDIVNKANERTLVESIPAMLKHINEG